MSDLVGIDVGGTFTDFVRYDPETQAVDVWKTLSTPADPIDGIIDGLDRSAMWAPIGNIRFGTTIATNAILERKGATVAYLTPPRVSRRALHPAGQAQEPLRHHLGQGRSRW